jgi:NAD+ kinase
VKGDENKAIDRLCVFVDPHNPPYAGLIMSTINAAEESGIELFSSGSSVDALAEFELLENEDCHACLVLGGDGTILRGLKYFRKVGMPVLGVNTGHLGFLASAEMPELPEILGFLKKGDYRIENYPLLRCELTSGQVLTAMNDICINRSILGGILHLELFLDHDRVAHIAGDGVVISTPLGSTAYGLSCGGPILDPALPAMLVIPICAHQLSLRPLVVPDSLTVTVETGELRGGAPFVSCDGSPEASMNAGNRLRITRDKGFCRMIQTRGRGSHYSHLGRKLGWGARGDTRC